MAGGWAQPGEPAHVGARATVVGRALEREAGVPLLAESGPSALKAHAVKSGRSPPKVVKSVTMRNLGFKP